MVHALGVLDHSTDRRSAVRYVLAAVGLVGGADRWSIDRHPRVCAPSTGRRQRKTALTENTIRAGFLVLLRSTLRDRRILPDPLQVWLLLRCDVA